MKNTIKKIMAAVAAISVIGTASISVSAATKEDVVAAARGAGFLEEYVMQLQNYLNVTTFTPEQYDIMVNKLSSVGSEMDDIAMQYFGKTIAQMKGEAEEKAEEEGTPVDDTWLNEFTDKLTEDNVVEIVDEIVDMGNDLGLDVEVEKKGDKNFTLTVKDKEGNVQFVAPIGKQVDRTGVSEPENNTASTAAFAVVTALGVAGIIVLTKAANTNEE